MFKLCQIGVTVIVKRCWVDGCGGGFGSAGVCGGGDGGGGGCGGDQCVVCSDGIDYLCFHCAKCTSLSQGCTQKLFSVDDF